MGTGDVAPVRRLREVRGRLYAEYHEVNDEHFGGLLPALAIRIRTLQAKRGKVGKVMEFVPHPYTGLPAYLLADETFVLTDDWNTVREKLRHEIVHVWQAVMGHHDNHGPTFRAMCKRLNIPAKAVD